VLFASSNCSFPVLGAAPTREPEPQDWIRGYKTTNSVDHVVQDLLQMGRMLYHSNQCKNVPMLVKCFPLPTFNLTSLSYVSYCLQQQFSSPRSVQTLKPKIRFRGYEPTNSIDHVVPNTIQMLDLSNHCKTQKLLVQKLHKIGQKKVRLWLKKTLLKHDAKFTLLDSPAAALDIHWLQGISGSNLASFECPRRSTMRDSDASGRSQSLAISFVHKLSGKT